jgi:hypothetical protein
MMKALQYLGLAGILAMESGAAPLDVAKATIVAADAASRIEAKAVAMLADEIERRTRVRLASADQLPTGAQVVILLGTAAELAAKSFAPPAGLAIPQRPDAYAIWVDARHPSRPTICLAGHDARGALFAAGRLLRLLDLGRDKVQFDRTTSFATAPQVPLRGHQLGYRPKTNSYDAWTLAMWEQYFRDMIVFGMNAVELIPPRSDDDGDSPHFPTPPMEMIVAMSQLASDYGLEVWVWYPAIDKDYTDPKTVEFALQERAEVFKRLPRLDAVFVPGGDPGDTRPEVLFSLLEKIKPVLTRHHPAAQLWVSPQGFDRPGKNREGWLQRFFELMQKERPRWLDGVVFGPQVETSLANLRQELPAQYPIRDYSDITHSRGCQYPVPNWDKAFNDTLGRECINPRPRGFAQIFQQVRPHTRGFITYSEGCNDDFNKVLWSCLGWDPAMPVEAITREYSRYFISGRFEESFSRGLLALEENWVGPLRQNDGVEATLRRFQEMERAATPQDRLNWRFQQGLYRAYYDAYLRARLIYETGLEAQARTALKSAPESGALAAVARAEEILARADAPRTAPELRARVFELAEALYQSIRMQLSVERYQAIAVNRGANLDEIDKPLNRRVELQQRLDRIRALGSEPERLAALARFDGN